MNILRFPRPPDPDPFGDGSDVVRQEQRQDPDVVAVMNRLGAGEIAALDELLDRFWAPVVAYVSRMVDDVDVATDIAQETFCRIWDRRGEWHGGSVRGYLFRVARNLSVDELRTRRARARAETKSEIIQVVSPHTPETLAERSELVARVDEVIQHLPPRRREALTLVYLRGLTYREAAEIMDISVKTLGNQLSAAVAELKVRMTEILEMDDLP